MLPFGTAQSAANCSGSCGHSIWTISASRSSLQWTHNARESICVCACVCKWMYSVSLYLYLPELCRVLASRTLAPCLRSLTCSLSLPGFELLRRLSPAAHNFYMHEKNKYINKWIFCLARPHSAPYLPPSPVRSLGHLSLTGFVKRDWKWKCPPGSTSFAVCHNYLPL